MNGDVPVSLDLFFFGKVAVAIWFDLLSFDAEPEIQAHCSSLISW